MFAPITNPQVQDTNKAPTGSRNQISRLRGESNSLYTIGALPHNRTSLVAEEVASFYPDYLLSTGMETDLKSEPQDSNLYF